MSQKIIKIVLMTKDEKQLIKQWIKYHGEIFGYENIHLLDDSVDKEVLDYYDTLKYTGIHFHRTPGGNLNNACERLNILMDSLRSSCDFMIKMDTDEFLGFYDEKSNRVSIDKKEILDYLNILEINGYKYKCWGEMRNCPLDSKKYPSDYTRFMAPRKNPFKTFFYSGTFCKVDLGSHQGWVTCLKDSAEYKSNPDSLENSEKWITSKMIIIHFHNQSYESFYEVSEKVCYSHEYIHPNDTKEVKIKKLTELLEKRPGCASCHKARHAIEYYNSTDENREKYYERFKNDPTGNYIYEDLYQMVKDVEPF